MSTTYQSLQHLPDTTGYQPGDVLVLVGELFGRGYANGLIEAARRSGMTIIGTTVGRRDSDGALRPLTPEELTEAEALLGSSIINIPLEAGFDMESPGGEPSICDRLKKLKADEWDSITFPADFVSQARHAGITRFRAALAGLMDELTSRIPAGAKVVFAHTMAGGIPRARVLMPLLNRVFKGTGDKYLSSAQFWASDLGQLCSASFDEVTADTFRHLIEVSAPLRDRISAQGGGVRYTAYGYHGTEVIFNGGYHWQSYTPYLQGWGKMRLEDIAEEATIAGVTATVFNCPEIQTNSSALFLGVEISLYPLITALVQQMGETAATPLVNRCAALLKEGTPLSELLARTETYLSSPLLAGLLDLRTWPQHSTKEQMELMLTASSDIMAMHCDQKNLVCAELSRIVFLATGQLMLHTSLAPPAAVLWLNHDIIARLLTDPQGEHIL